MIELVDFTNLPLSSRNLQYGGRAGEKRGVVYKKSFWFLKFPKNANTLKQATGISYITSPLSEYLGSHIYKILGIKSHQTELGLCFDGKRYKVVCACEDFIKDDKNELLIPYTSLRNDTNEELMDERDRESFSASNIDEIIFQLDHNTAFREVKNAKEMFWDCVIVDILINNNDRNEDNWGLIKFKDTGKYCFAPVYDCGNAFNAKLTDDKMISIMSRADVFENSALNGITAYETKDEKPIRCQDMMEIKNEDFKRSILKLVPIIEEKMTEITRLFNLIPEEINGIEVLSKIRREFYLESLKLRFEKLLKKTYFVLRK